MNYLEKRGVDEMRQISDSIKKNDTAKDKLINRIIDMEWDLFDHVTNTGGRAACQDDEWTFYVMRYSQFASFNKAMLESCERDLLMAQLYGYASLDDAEAKIVSGKC